MAENTTPKARFIAAVTEALNHYNETAADEFGFDIGDDVITVEFYDGSGIQADTFTADLSAITVTEED